MKRIVIAISIVIIFCFAECRKVRTLAPDNPYGLPNATQTGANMFACRIDGKNFIVNNGNYLSGWMSSKRDSLVLHGQFGNANYFLDIYIGDLKKERKANQNYYFQDTSNTYFVYNTDPSCLGISPHVVTVFKSTGVIIYSKVDTVNQIVSGTFNCQIPVPNCDTLAITDGRFDIIYHY